MYIIEIKIDKPIPCGKVCHKTAETVTEGEYIALAECLSLIGEIGLFLKVKDGACYNVMQGGIILGHVWIYEHKGK